LFVFSIFVCYITYNCALAFPCLKRKEKEKRNKTTTKKIKKKEKEKKKVPRKEKTEVFLPQKRHLPDPIHSHAKVTCFSTDPRFSKCSNVVMFYN